MQLNNFPSYEVLLENRPEGASSHGSDVCGLVR